MTRVAVLNGTFDRVTGEEAVAAIFDDTRRGWVCTVNVALLMMMRTDAALQRFVDRATLTVADGQPIVWCSPWFGPRLPERVAGIDLIDAVSARAAVVGQRVFFLGASPTVLDTFASVIRQRHPGLADAGADGYFPEADAAAVADRVRAHGTDILFVGMGVPRQERFVDEQWDRLGVRTAIGVGGSFDVLAGVRHRAPRWVQAVGMEWFFRLAQEPRRLFMRYLTTNTKFLGLMAQAVCLAGVKAVRGRSRGDRRRATHEL